MLIDFNQRWRNGRTIFRPAGETIDPRRHSVQEISYAEALAFCVSHHYSGSFPAARKQYGLLRTGLDGHERLVGIVVMSVPAQQKVFSKYLGTSMDESLEMGRVVVHQDVEGNGCSWMIAGVCQKLYKDTPFRSIVSYADPVARIAQDGTVIKPGHMGTIYQAVNARMVGKSSQRTLVMTRKATILNGRSLSKVRRQSSGWEGAYQQMLQAGAPPKQANEDWQQYVTRALSEGPFSLHRHPGNFVYVWTTAQSSSGKRHYERRFPPAQPYPKACDFNFEPMRFLSKPILTQKIGQTCPMATAQQPLGQIALL